MIVNAPLADMGLPDLPTLVILGSILLLCLAVIAFGAAGAAVWIVGPRRGRWLVAPGLVTSAALIGAVSAIRDLILALGVVVAVAFASAIIQRAAVSALARTRPGSGSVSS